MKSITMEEIAKSAGVSVSTISRFLDGKNINKVNENTRAKILKVIKRKRFYPNLLARDFVRKTVRTVGLVFPYGMFFFGSNYTSEISRGLVEGFEEFGKHILMLANRNPLKRFDYKWYYHTRTIGGLVLIAPGIKDRNAIMKIKREKIPFVVVNADLPDKNICCIDSDNMTGGYLATKHLIQLGHKRIGHIRGYTDSWNACQRLEGYKKALTENNIPIDKNLITTGYFTEEGGAKAMEQFFSRQNYPEAIFAGNDDMAIGAIRVIKKKGLSVPGDIAVVGYDDGVLASVVDPSLTTVKQSIYEIGKKAAQILAENMDNDKKTVRREILPVELVIRSSCGFIHS
ncbi:MAG: LacI family DNA-binding transcriptional regulator [Elusimicrobia bacterium]|nr:LacI family DNA-binding transcriptional regulator [Elusimicrobiota bacterium]